MANGDLAATSRVANPYRIGDRWQTVTAIDLGAYATGGYTLARTTLGFASTTDPEFHVEVESGPYTLRYDHTNQKLLAYRQTAATGGFVEVPNATDLSAVTGVRATATGRYRA